MAVTNPLFNDEKLAVLKKNIEEVSKKDNQEDFRVDVVEYINDSSYEASDEFFFDYLVGLRFLEPGNDAIAYTVPDGRIYMNCPNDKINGIREWDFIYDHECLHQLWETFDVQHEIERDFGSCDYELLNIASDCVINDYLAYYRKKKMPSVGINPKNLEEHYGVVYDRKKDTQYTLYVKLLKLKEEQEELYKKLKDAIIDNFGGGGKQGGDPGGQQGGQGGDPGGQQGGDPGGNQGGQQGGDPGGQQGGQGGSGSQDGNGGGSGGNGFDNMSSDDAAKSAEESAKAAQDASDKAGEASNKPGEGVSADKAEELAEDAKKAAKEAQEAADKAKEAAKSGDKEAAVKAAKDAADAAQKAKDALSKIQGGKSSDGKSSDGDAGGKDSGGGGAGKSSADAGAETEEDIEKIKSDLKKVIDKYKNRIAGDFGIFIEKCKKSKELKKSGLAINTQKGQTGWNQQMNSCINTYVKKRVFEKKREYKRTYSRVKRGSGFIKQGAPIIPGKKLRLEKLTINVSFYIDRSGSMSGDKIENVFKAAYAISESLKKQFSKEKVVDEVTFKMFAFDQALHELKWGSKISANGGTMDFDKILDCISRHTKDFMINVIITDGEFSVNAGEVDKFIKDIDGMILFITNGKQDTVKACAKKHNTQLFYIEADSAFTIGNN